MDSPIPTWIWLLAPPTHRAFWKLTSPQFPHLHLKRVGTWTTSARWAEKASETTKFKGLVFSQKDVQKALMKETGASLLHGNGTPSVGPGAKGPRKSSHSREPTGTSKGEYQCGRGAAESDGTGHPRVPPRTNHATSLGLCFCVCGVGPGMPASSAGCVGWGLNDNTLELLTPGLAGGGPVPCVSPAASSRAALPPALPDAGQTPSLSGDALALCPEKGGLWGRGMLSGENVSALVLKLGSRRLSIS